MDKNSLHNSNHKFSGLCGFHDFCRLYVIYHHIIWAQFSEKGVWCEYHGVHSRFLDHFTSQFISLGRNWSDIVEWPGLESMWHAKIKCLRHSRELSFTMICDWIRYCGCCCCRNNRHCYRQFLSISSSTFYYVLIQYNNKNSHRTSICGLFVCLSQSLCHTITHLVDLIFLIYTIFRKKSKRSKTTGQYCVIHIIHINVLWCICFTNVGLHFVNEMVIITGSRFCALL